MSSFNSTFPSRVSLNHVPGKSSPSQSNEHSPYEKEEEPEDEDLEIKKPRKTKRFKRIKSHTISHDENDSKRSFSLKWKQKKKEEDLFQISHPTNFKTNTMEALDVVSTEIQKKEEERDWIDEPKVKYMPRFSLPSFLFRLPPHFPPSPHPLFAPPFLLESDVPAALEIRCFPESNRRQFRDW